MLRYWTFNLSPGIQSALAQEKCWQGALPPHLGDPWRKLIKQQLKDFLAFCSAGIMHKTMLLTQRYTHSETTPVNPCTKRSCLSQATATSFSMLLQAPLLSQLRQVPQQIKHKAGKPNGVLLGQLCFKSAFTSAAQLDMWLVLMFAAKTTQFVRIYFFAFQGLVRDNP